MSQAVLEVSLQTIEAMKAHYASSITDKCPPGSLFVSKLPTCTITAYRSKKVLFQGKTAELEANKWGNATSNKPKTASKKPNTLPAGFSNWSCMGSDEVGTGDYFGPIVVASAYCSKENIQTLQALGVKDSKDLSDPQIIQIAKQLIHLIPNYVLVLHNPKYNELQKRGMSQGKMKALLHNRVLYRLHEMLEGQYDAILVDQFVEASTYFKHIEREQNKITTNIYFATKGESHHLAVAAASIIARWTFLAQMDKLSQKMGTTLKKGAGSQVDQVAAVLIKTYGEAILNDCAKLHFANTQKAKKLAQK